MELVYYYSALCFILLSVIEPTHSEGPCDNIKDSQRRIFCYQLQKWDTEARIPPKGNACSLQHYLKYQAHI